SWTCRPRSMTASWICSNRAGRGEWARTVERHDNLLRRTMLGIMDVQTQVYDGKLDLFKSCRAG
ncbi:hypothetical protein NUK32_14670, partial [Aeromonas caviae]|uniref:hypothetical protein n=1 Tax=Aeromonas caviae TaxID=648 RepID=UPI00214D3F64